MGRRAYLNRLALGRSPYEAPERTADASEDPETSSLRRTSALHADGYIQHYDDRAHPVNPESKAFGRELRRAKNDILSTMGIVVSEDGNRGRSEQQKIDVIVAENDYGLVMVTLDQISAFLGSWWTSSLTSRIQTFKSYTHMPLISIINHERASLGAFGFYFAGVPAWALSTCFSICRHHPLERLIAAIQSRFPNNDTGSKIIRASFTILHSATRGALLVLAIQTYMYSLLQSLHLVPPASLPGVGFFMPFGGFASTQMPHFPATFSFSSLSNFVLGLLKTPSLFYIYMYLRPVVEIRLYRFIRRRLPKPSLTDDLSIKVAFDNDLIDWMVPTLGRRSEEEIRRSNLSLMDDLLYEVNALREWVSSRLGFRRSRTFKTPGHTDDTLRGGESSELLSGDTEQTQRQQSASSSHDSPMRPVDHLASFQGQSHNPQNESSFPDLPAATLEPHPDSNFSGRRPVSNDENQIPDVNNSEYMDLTPLSRARDVSHTTSTSPLPDPQVGDDDIATNGSRRSSRSNTLFSHSSSSEPSSESSPHVRAQLLQNSDVIAMELELESRHIRGEENSRAENEADRPNLDGEPADRRSISDFLDSLLANQGQNLATIITSETMDSGPLSSLTTGGSPETGDHVTASASRGRRNDTREALPILDSAVEATTSTTVNILPDVIEEPPADEANDQTSEAQPNLENDRDSEIIPHISESSVRQDSVLGNAATTSTTAHRVTILSALPVDSLASHLASMITTATFIPLESLYLRSLASSYLSTTGASDALKSDVYGLGVWCGGRSRPDTLAYLGKLALMMGVQAAVNASVWGIISGAAIKIGRRWCGWGTL